MTQTVIAQFQGEHRFLSNFWPCPRLLYAGLNWPSVEHAYQAMKSDDPAVWEHIRRMKGAGLAKTFGRTIPMKPSWDTLKLHIMQQLTRAKYLQNRDLQLALLGTGDAWLEEGNLWKDRFWGICPPGSDIGENHLGKILMQVRKEIRNGKLKGI